MVRFGIQTLIISTIAALVAGCSSVPLQTDLPVMDFVTATLAATIPPASTPIIVVSPPNTAIPAATQFCMGYLASWSCTCGELPGDFIQIKRAEAPGQCNIYMKDAYSLSLPDNWYCNAAGVSATNLFCLTAQGQHISVRSIPSELPVEKADQAISIFQEGEGTYADPVVEADEERITREVKTIQDWQVLSLLTQKDGVYILRVFMNNDGKLLVFKSESTDLAEIEGSTRIVEAAIHSMKFAQ